MLALFGDSRMAIFSMQFRFPITVSFAQAGSTSAGVLNMLANLKNVSATNPDRKIDGIFIQVGVNDMRWTNYRFGLTDFKSNHSRLPLT